MTAYSSFDDLPRKHYQVILADPPWRFKTYAPQKAETSRHAEKHYPTMNIEAIKALPVRQIAAKNCYLMLWTSWPFMAQAFDVLAAWGFTYSSDFKLWMKLKRNFSETRAFVTIPLLIDGRYPQHDFHTGTGYTTRKNTEPCLLGRRGSPKRLVRDEPELLIAPVREHSRKPDEMIAMVERYASGPYLELFARAERPGWDAFGDQIDRFIAPPALPPAAAPNHLVQPSLFGAAE